MEWDDEFQIGDTVVVVDESYIDPYGYLWCKNCFVPKSLPEFDVAENEDIVSFLGV